MIKLLRIIYSVYAGLLFIGSFLAIFPFFLICIWIPGWQRFGRKINRYWAKVYFTLIFLPVHMEKKCKLEKGKPYLFLANHFSYLDIAMMGFIPGDVQFVGKASIRKAPLFGYYFKKLHIAVDRSRLKSRAETMRRAGLALDNGSSIVLFPEGGIYSTQPPQMVPFKNGAFRLAVEKQIPIIPVTLSFNHLILPEGKGLLLNLKRAKMVLHEAILPTVEDTEDSLKEKCFEVIQAQLNRDNLGNDTHED
ncbi:MAG TPA: 1-acyl-sn-glycerol-3-phosphate acyltransferase [Algoriphagus sp.]|jgi:1-acyl-sn-glycerol-3-phosphate acyltransferase|uniref:lysophospholipid acyltransferase family protein n=2 Tax=Algoriphagus TaxID=246875 RepID=UPI000C56117B|nr:1-acyl-sn-glycerol-3-phosphate acyltransferase [Algoriphagus sp.]MAN86647.1 1-acyl-sn-glycerol-3-phosphate acyltransferase [Algoriphagus sp.]HAD50299.1 1-acyl-sn-glycerol-3-phosphate acyltransferase [Algoriphagus sp.]HAH37666.1 1-acyl-sn-glycerol-3-phosphate acyltransferase [Algoriphagus sp.]HCD89125.1 1-acyl-sn-glycerol-3-phosphate acyltransferase [Algoriphagus sp.]|tara:strand:+ start:42 stop:788 length:747 start_codon:yes stop_codon:yes gene_type:complete